ncbi:unnamed protein product [Fusarium graminearum]|uniref:Chromosome 3, complete genome n=2 Tax=Gibberella zeae TaxID=5518 RepID=I1RPE6_GIBZE|nr:hypothetical protein FGSG_05913 [Fusarium graminearum PH-1]EYB32957.1 hypothetical protein FG05_05913 [Fusarium graminearum]ESU11946.1 hypothetical protein FGSG_05913 [Fusarium graminearum PH-1]CAF3459752.1 unnamed protein product [Fusarium graminearum]CAF3488659.1 unnamed protein product [Fusarium graminearum]CAF3584572.1 unnamed protein product [Fusarium graminearum]|eukprot:XP_011324522.1 hypothetical protein FGSG_05913 [Fusarium graminearum PH-1]
MDESNASASASQRSMNGQRNVMCDPSNLDRSVTEAPRTPSFIPNGSLSPGSMSLLFDTPQTIVGRPSRSRGVRGTDPSSVIGKGSDARASPVQPADALSWLYQRANKMKWNGLFNETGLRDLGYNLTAIVDL